MFASDFQRKLKKLNKHLQIKCNENPNFPAGLYYNSGPDLVHICGVDRNEIPEYTVWDKQFILKCGWRRVLNILVKNEIVDRNRVREVFGTDLSYGHRPKRLRWEDPIDRALREARDIGKAKAQSKSRIELPDKQDGKPINYMELDDLLSISRMRKREENYDRKRDC